MELDEFPPEWPLRRLADLCQICIGRTPARANRAYWENGRHAWAAISDLNGAELTETKEAITDTAIQECRCRPVEPGTLLFSFKLSIGKMAFAGRRLFTNEAIAALPVKAHVDLDAKFLALAFKVVPLLDEASDAAKGTTLNKGSLSELQIPVPPLAEQRRLVARIEALTSRLEQARQARHSALEEADTFLDSTLQRVFDDFDKRSPLGSFVRIQGGFAFKSTTYTTDGTPLIRISNLVNDSVVADENVCIPPEIATKQSAFCLQTGDVLIALSGATTGKLGVVPPEGNGWLLNQRVGRFVPRDPTKTDKRFVFWAAKRVQRFVLDSAYGGAQPNISPKDIEQMEFPFPPFTEQRRIVERLDALAAKQAELRRLQTETEAELASFTPALLAKAFRGEL